MNNIERAYCFFNIYYGNWIKNILVEKNVQYFICIIITSLLVNKKQDLLVKPLTTIFLKQK